MTTVLYCNPSPPLIEITFCRYGEGCFNKECSYPHSVGEAQHSKEELASMCRALPQSTWRTRVCRDGFGCSNPGCWFAHSKGELVVPPEEGETIDYLTVAAENEWKLAELSDDEEGDLDCWSSRDPSYIPKKPGVFAILPQQPKAMAECTFNFNDDSDDDDLAR